MGFAQLPLALSPISPMGIYLEKNQRGQTRFDELKDSQNAYASEKKNLNELKRKMRSDIRKMRTNAENTLTASPADDTLKRTIKNDGAPNSIPVWSVYSKDKMPARPHRRPIDIDSEIKAMYENFIGAVDGLSEAVEQSQTTKELWKFFEEWFKHVKYDIFHNINDDYEAFLKASGAMISKEDERGRRENTDLTAETLLYGDEDRGQKGLFDIESLKYFFLSKDSIAVKMGKSSKRRHDADERKDPSEHGAKHDLYAYYVSELKKSKHNLNIAHSKVGPLKAWIERIKEEIQKNVKKLNGIAQGMGIKPELMAWAFTGEALSKEDIRRGYDKLPYFSEKSPETKEAGNLRKLVKDYKLAAHANDSGQLDALKDQIELVARIELTDDAHDSLLRMQKIFLEIKKLVHGRKNNKGKWVLDDDKQPAETGLVNRLQELGGPVPAQKPLTIGPKGTLALAGPGDPEIKSYWPLDPYYEPDFDEGIEPAIKALESKVERIPGMLSKDDPESLHPDASKARFTGNYEKFEELVIKTKEELARHFKSVSIPATGQLPVYMTISNFMKILQYIERDAPGAFADPDISPIRIKPLSSGTETQVIKIILMSDAEVYEKFVKRHKGPTPSKEEIKISPKSPPSAHGADLEGPAEQPDTLATQIPQWKGFRGSLRGGTQENDPEETLEGLNVNAIKLNKIFDILRRSLLPTTSASLFEDDPQIYINEIFDKVIKNGMEDIKLIFHKRQYHGGQLRKQLGLDPDAPDSPDEAEGPVAPDAPEAPTTPEAPKEVEGPGEVRRSTKDKTQEEIRELIQLAMDDHGGMSDVDDPDFVEDEDEVVEEEIPIEEVEEEGTEYGELKTRLAKIIDEDTHRFRQEAEDKVGWSEERKDEHVRVSVLESVWRFLTFKQFALTNFEGEIDTVKKNKKQNEMDLAAGTQGATEYFAGQKQAEVYAERLANDANMTPAQEARWKDYYVSKRSEAADMAKWGDTMSFRNDMNMSSSRSESALRDPPKDKDKVMKDDIIRTIASLID